TAGLDRSAVRGINRLPSPPARTIARTLRAMDPTLTTADCPHQGTRGISVRDVTSASRALRVDLLTREYPPDVYGGAGVHVEYLARELRALADVRVHCFGKPPHHEPGVTAYADPPGLAGANAALRTMGVDLEMAAGCAG